MILSNSGSYGVDLQWAKSFMRCWCEPSQGFWFDNLHFWFHIVEELCRAAKWQPKIAGVRYQQPTIAVSVTLEQRHW